MQIYHPCGTAKMGDLDADPTAVVSAKGCVVRGFTNLRVADASVFPEITSGNTNAPTIMVAERVAEWIRAEWRGREDATRRRSRL